MANDQVFQKPMPGTSNIRLNTTKLYFQHVIRQLYSKTQEPITPTNYRGGTFPRSKIHALLHEEEQHLADHIAVLAHAREGPRNVSAATIEECNNQALPSLMIRIASNETPSEHVVDGLRKCLNIVEKVARAGRFETVIFI